jgi:hypothetical protein
MLVFVTRCNTGAMSRCVSIPMQNLPVRPGIQRGTKIQGCFSFSYLQARQSISSITFNNGLMIGFVSQKYLTGRPKIKPSGMRRVFH